MTTLLFIALILATILNVSIIFGAGYVTACYVQYLRNKKSNKSKNEESQKA